MDEGFAPRHLESEIVALGKKGDHVTAGQFSGEDALPSSYHDEVIGKICSRWADDGKPKAIVRVPPMRGGSGSFVARLIRALIAVGARVLDATGTTSEDKQRFLRALEAERGREDDASRYDVLVGIQRVMEGTDWPVCSAVYCVGMPGSLNTVVQLLGRAMRRKDEHYPKEYRDRARLVFFVPCASGDALSELSIDHSRHALLTCCFLADHTIGQEWIVLREVRGSIESALGTPVDNPQAADAENEADAPLDPEVRAEVELVLASAREQLVTNDEGRGSSPPTIGDIVQRAMQSRPDLPEPAFQRVAAEILAAESGSTGNEARAAIRKEIARRLRIDPRVREAMAEAFAVVLDKFRDATLRDSPVLEAVRQQVHQVTGGQMREFAERLRQAAPRPLTEEMILALADQHMERTGEWPHVASGEVEGAPGEKWLNLNAALDQGLRSLPGGSSLAKLLYEKRGVRTWASAPNLTREDIRQWITEHFERTGEYPGKDSGIISGTNGETWLRVDAALKMGLRGLSGGSSLPQFLEVEFGVRNRLNLPDLSTEMIRAWITAHHAANGGYPKSSSGKIAGTNDETWVGVDAALRLGYRGLPGGSSLASFLQEHFGVKNIHDLSDLKREQIKEWIQAHYLETGKYPAASSGAIAGTTGETWQGINLALWKGRRGFPGGSSLAQFIADEFGQRNRGNLPPFTHEQIKQWVVKWHQRTGKYPKSNSGEIPGTEGETWAAVNDNLKSGSRGLPGGSSLPRFLEQEFGVRNRLNPPQLTVERIKELITAWKNRTGEFPSAQSGDIPDIEGITWRIVDKALRRGSHGLPGGSSLPQFLEEHFGKRNIRNLPQLTTEVIKGWIMEYRRKNGKDPVVLAGDIPGSDGETWQIVDRALTRGLRGLRGGSSLFKFIRQHLPSADSDGS
jgi:hypothetical protein